MDIREQKLTGVQIQRHPWELARLELVILLLERMPIKRDDLKIVDIGCGDLFFLRELAKHFKFGEYYAIDSAFTDKDLNEINASYDEYGLKAYSDIKDCQTKDASVILMLDVVEHIEDDLAFMRDLYSSSMLGSDTVIIITVPAYESLFCSHDRFLLHYRRYNNRTLKALLTKSNFEVINIGYFFFLLLVPRILNVIIERLIKKKKPSEGTGLSSWNGGSIITLIIKQILVFDFKVGFALRRLRLNVPGLSNFAICKKNV